MRTDLPVLGICGRSGAGRTSLLEHLVGDLLGRGLRVAVVKHDAQGVTVDRPGKGSDRLYRSGADVLPQSPEQEFSRRHGPAEDLSDMVDALCERYDVVLVEGQESSPIPKLWLLSEGRSSPPPDVEGVLAVLPRGPGRLPMARTFVADWLERQWRSAPVYGCVLIGGKSRRMGTPKHLLQADGQTWVERTTALLRQTTCRVVLAGNGHVPASLAGQVQLADAPDVAGPMAGMLAAMRWAPRANWLMAACDLPLLSVDALEWLLAARRPGTWALLPRLDRSPGVEPLLAYYDFRARRLLEGVARRGSRRPADIIDNETVFCPPVPQALAGAWRNINTRDQLQGYRALRIG